MIDICSNCKQQPHSGLLFLLTKCGDVNQNKYHISVEGKAYIAVQNHHKPGDLRSYIANPSLVCWYQKHGNFWKKIEHKWSIMNSSVKIQYSRARWTINEPGIFATWHLHIFLSSGLQIFETPSASWHLSIFAPTCLRIRYNQMRKLISYQQVVAKTFSFVKCSSTLNA